jgi:uracil-DNA glycosylase family 4
LSGHPASRPTLSTIHNEIVACSRCDRLRAHCTHVAQVKRAAYRHQTYWGRPLPGFGDPHARLLVVGLAPGAHGANRTGRMFTGDSAGAFLMRAMHANGFANRPASISADDGLELVDAFIATAVRCAPPDNKPTPEEFAACLPHLDAEWRALPRVAAVVALGRLAFDACWRVLARRGCEIKPRPAFAHGAEQRVDASGGITPLTVIASFHPSQQNTFTGRLTPEMLEAVFRRARAVLPTGSGAITAGSATPAVGRK